MVLLGPLAASTTRLARRRTTLLPAMRLAEALETMRLHRVAGLTGARTTWVTTRPCRAPQQTISDVGRIGGGQMPLPGEVSAGLLGQASWDTRARALPRSGRCPLHFAVENHDNAGEI